MLQELWLNVERLVQLTGATVKRRSDMGNVRKTEAGANLQRWFKEKWVDVRTGKPCGRERVVLTLIAARLSEYHPKPPKRPKNSRLLKNAVAWLKRKVRRKLKELQEKRNMKKERR